jgi:hypothetical protein
MTNVGHRKTRSAVAVVLCFQLIAGIGYGQSKVSNGVKIRLTHFSYAVPDVLCNQCDLNSLQFS